MNSHNAGCAIAFVVGREGRTLRMLSHVIRLILHVAPLSTMSRRLGCYGGSCALVLRLPTSYTSASYLLACPHVVSSED